MKKIRLYDLRAVMLVIDHPSGVIYANQAGGTSCLQPELEGVLVPLELEPSRLAALFGTASSEISPAIANAIDKLLASGPGTSSLRVDRARLAESYEAWVHVTGESPPVVRDVDATETFFGEWYGFGSLHGVLTWPNRD
jgi:hypothetical protein